MQSALNLLPYAAAAAAVATPPVRRLLSSTPRVNDDGTKIQFHNQWENSVSTVIEMPFAQAAGWMHRYRQAVMQAVVKQRLTLDRGAEVLHNVMRSAPSPAHVAAVQEKETGDLILTFQFTDSPPISFRGNEFFAQRLIHEVLAALKFHH